jgi:hypothetical protein
MDLDGALGHHSDRLALSEPLDDPIGAQSLQERLGLCIFQYLHIDKEAPSGLVRFHDVESRAEYIYLAVSDWGAGKFGLEKATHALGVFGNSVNHALARIVALSRIHTVLHRRWWSRLRGPGGVTKG